MESRLVLLSGPVSSGKSTLAAELHRRFGAEILKTSVLLEARSTTKTRGHLQLLGQRLDVETGGLWVAEALVHRFPDLVDLHQLVVVDAVRFIGQVEALREAFGSNRVVHVHLTAPFATLEGRYLERAARDETKEFRSYTDVQRNRTERDIESLAPHADVVVNTSRNRRSDVLVRVASRLGLYSALYAPTVDVVIGGQYGSEGKGHIAGYLSPEYDVLVRSGGPNAGHSVMLPSGKSQVQHHLPSGTGTSDALLVLTAGAVIEPTRLLSEIVKSKVGTDRLFIDPRAMVITEEDKAAEVALQATIGSTGQGVGAATARKIMGRSGGVRLAADFPEIAPYTARTAGEVLEQQFAAGGRVLVEGTQGTALSLHHGPYPYVTSRDTSVSGVLAESGIAPARVRRILMVCRTYPIRVESPEGGTSGPMDLEISWEEVAARADCDAEDLARAERTTTTGRLRRVQEFDWQLLHQCSELNRPTDVALTFVDYLHPKNRHARRFDQLHPDTMEFIDEVEHVSSAQVVMVSIGFHSRAILDRRKWR